MRFEWDAEKDSKNLKKHGIAFSTVIPVFFDPHIVTIFDEEHSDYDEDRWISMGLTEKGLVCLISHTFRTKDNIQVVRLISARKADSDEEMQYYSHKGR